MGFDYAVGDAEPEERADAARGFALRAPEELVEVVVDGPCAVHAVGRLDRHEQLRKEPLQDPQEKRAGIAEPGELLRQQRPCQVGRILLQRQALLVAPGEADGLMADQPEGLDGHAAFPGQEDSVLECLADVVVRRRATRIDHAQGECGALPRQHDDAAAVRGERDHREDHVEIERRIQNVVCQSWAKSFASPPGSV